MIRVTYETIWENTQTFMCPEFYHIILSLNCLRWCSRNSLEDFAHITKVISIMRLSRSRTEVLLDKLVNIYSVWNNTITHALNSLGIWRILVLKEEPFHHIVENIVHRFLRVGLNIKNIEVTHVTRRYMVAATTWRAHSRNDHCINDVSEGVLVITALVPAALVD
jgi:hypothetical protein